MPIKTSGPIAATPPDAPKPVRPPAPPPVIIRRPRDMNVVPKP